MSDFLPPSFDYVSDYGAGAYDPNTGQWTVGALVNAGTATLNIVAEVIASGELCNTATITAGTPLDTIPGNNQATACVEAARSADLQLTVVQTASPVQAGAPLSFAYTVWNNGVDDAYAKATFAPSPAIAMTASGPGNPTRAPTPLAARTRGTSATYRRATTAS